MDNPQDKNFVQQMRDALQKQLSEIELVKKKEERDAKIVASEGAKRWSEVKDSLKRHVEEINDGFEEGLLSYRENADGSQFIITPEFNVRTVQVTFDPATAVISYQGSTGNGAFRPRIEGDTFEYGWENATPCGGVKPLRKVRPESYEPPIVSTERITEIIIRCVVMEPASDD